MADELDPAEFELAYVRPEDVPQREKEGWRSASRGRMGHHAAWAVLMRREINPEENT